MSTQSLKTQKDDFVGKLPHLENSNWILYNFTNGTIVPAGQTWEFGKNNTIKTNPVIWNGTWEEESNSGDKIVVKTNTGATYDLIFVTQKHYIGTQNGDLLYFGARK
jgi:hypothetical protein